MDGQGLGDSIYILFSGIAYIQPPDRVGPFLVEEEIAERTGQGVLPFRRGGDRLGVGGVEGEAEHCIHRSTHNAVGLHGVL